LCREWAAKQPHWPCQPAPPNGSMNSSAAAVAALSLAGTAVLVKQALGWRVGKRLSTVGSSSNGTSNAAAAVTPIEATVDEDALELWRLHQAPAGLLDRWYMAQLPGQKRDFVEALKLRGVPPSELQLAQALTTMAQAHPRLLMLPHPVAYRLHSQFPTAVAAAAAAGVPRGQVPYPLPCLARCVTPSVQWEAKASDDAARRAQLKRVLNDYLNTPVSDDPAAEECEPGAGGLLAHSWKPLTLQLVSDGSDAEQEFVLVLHIAHTVGDGMSGFIFFRLLLETLGALRRSAEPAPTTVPVASFLPLSAYPSVDDMTDMRPRVRRIANLLMGDIGGKLRAKLGMKGKSWYDGNDGRFDCATTRTSLLQLGPETSRSLFAHAKKHGVTVHGVLTAATSMACALASGKDELGVLSGTAINTRGLCTDKPGVEDLLGNFVASHEEIVDFSSKDQAGKQELYSLARAFLARLKSPSAREHSLDTIGLIGLVDARTYVAEQDGQRRNRRNATSNLSNVGVVGAPGSPLLSEEMLTAQGFQLLDAFFAQTVRYTCPLWGHNAVSCPNGGLNLMTCSPAGLVSDEQARVFETALEFILCEVAAGREIEYGAMAEEWRRADAAKQS